MSVKTDAKQLRNDTIRRVYKENNSDLEKTLEILKHKPETLGVSKKVVIGVLVAFKEYKKQPKKQSTTKQSTTKQELVNEINNLLAKAVNKSVDSLVKANKQDLQTMLNFIKSAFEVEEALVKPFDK